jgi:hypothetical protein
MCWPVSKSALTDAVDVFLCCGLDVISVSL